MDRAAKIKLIFWITLALNLGVAGGKLLFAAMTQSLSLFSDGLHSLMDGGSNIVALIAIRIAERPPDEDHPYGHRKFETLGAMAISGLLCLASWEILQAGWERFIHPVELPHVRWVAVGGLVFMIILNAAITWYERHWGRRLQSELLLADAEHTLSDALASGLALVALLSALVRLYWVDTLAALIIVVLILRAAYRIVKAAQSRTDPAAGGENRRRRKLPHGPLARNGEGRPGRSAHCDFARVERATGV
jgi:cation diffusion facilitator family transporter